MTQLEAQNPLKMNFIACLLMLPFFGISLSTEAQESLAKVDVMAGIYSLSAKTEEASGSLSQFGLYKVGYRRSLLKNLEFGASYSLFTSEIAGGDLGFGPDLTLVYYPMTSASPLIFKTDEYKIFLSEKMKPYIFGGFHQRNFQSFNASFAGFGAGAGLDYTWQPEFSLRGEIRYLSLYGPSKSTASVIDVLFGVSFFL